MDKKTAIERFQKQTKHIEQLKTKSLGDPEFTKWKRSTEVLIENVFGEDKQHVKDFNSIHYSLMAWTLGTPDSEFQRAYIGGLEEAQSILESFIEEITEYWPNETIKNKRKKKDDLSSLTVPNIDFIWHDININFDVNKRAFGKKINFISESFRRKIIFRDIAHSYYLANNGFSKSAVILAGSVIEELLRLYLKHKGIRVSRNKFDEYIRICESQGLLKSAISRLTDSVRHFRNLVHLEREVDVRHTISKATAIGAVSSIFTIVNDF